MSSQLDGSMWKEMDDLMQEIDKSYDHLASLPKYTTNSQYVSCFIMNGRHIPPPMLTQEQRQEMGKYKSIVNKKLQQRKLSLKKATKTRGRSGICTTSSKNKKVKQRWQLEKEEEEEFVDYSESVVDAYQKSSNDLLKLLEAENEGHWRTADSSVAKEAVEIGEETGKPKTLTEQPIDDHTSLEKSPHLNTEVETDDSELCLKLEELSMNTANLPKYKSDEIEVDTFKNGSLKIDSNPSSTGDKFDSGNGSKTEELSENTEIKIEESTTDSLLTQSSGKMSCQSNDLKKGLLPTKQDCTRCLDTNEHTEEVCSVVSESDPKHPLPEDNARKSDAEEELSNCSSDGEEELYVEALYKAEGEQASSVCASPQSETSFVHISTNVDTGHEYADNMTVPNYKLLSSFTSEWLQSLRASEEQSKESQVETPSIEDSTQLQAPTVSSTRNLVARDCNPINTFSPSRSMSPERCNRISLPSPTQCKTPDRASLHDKSPLMSLSEEDSSEIVLQSFMFDGRKMKRLEPTTITTENNRDEEPLHEDSSLYTSSPRSPRQKERRCGSTPPVREIEVMLQHQNKKLLENQKINEHGDQCEEYGSLKSSTGTRRTAHHDGEVWNKFSALVKGHLTRKLFYSRACVLVMQCIRDTSRALIALQEDRPKTPEESTLVIRLYAQVRSALYDFHDIFFNTTIKEQMIMIRNTHQLELKENISPRSSIPRLSKATQKSLERKKEALRKEKSDPSSSKDGRNIFVSSSVNFSKEAKSKISHIWKNNNNTRPTSSSSSRRPVNKSATTNKNTLKTRKLSCNH